MYRTSTPRHRGAFSIALAAFPLLLLASAGRANVVYVNRNAPGTIHDGAAWATGFTAIQAGIDAAKNGDEIWVAASSYSGSITLKGAIGLYGGFAGTEAAREARNPQANVTAVTGSPSAVVIPASVGPDTVIDGFTISGGTGTLIGPNTAGSRTFAGGGIFCLGSAIISGNTISGCYVSADRVRCGGAGQYACLSGAGWGGGIYCAQGSPTIRGNVIRDNQSETGGGAIYCGSGSPLIDSNTMTGNQVFFSGNWTGYFTGPGSGIYCANSNAVITNNTISSNQTSGIYSLGGNPVISGNTVQNHSDTGVYLSAGLCQGNVITGNRGGVYATGTAVVADNIIDSNKGGNGGGVYADAGAAVVSNLITNNTGSNLGGGCYSVGATVTDNTFVHNAAVDGGGIAIASYGLVANNIVTQNTSGVYAATVTPSTLPPDVRNNDVFQNTFVSTVAGAKAYEYGGALTNQTGSHGNIAADPLFVDSVGANYHLLPGSPCVDAGDDMSVFAARDVDGKPRRLGAHVDIGAYESGQASKVIRVSRNAPGPAHNGTTWANAFPTVQAGLDAASPGDEVWVAAAVYAGSIALPNGVALYGGFAGSETERFQRDPRTNVTTLDANGNGTVVTVPVGVTQPAVLDGFTIRHGGSGGISVQGRAGIARCIVVSNSGANGAGVLVNGTASISDCLLFGNSASAAGGGMAVSGSSSLSNVTVAGNNAPSGGGLSVGSGGVVAMANSILAANNSGIFVSGGAVSLSHCDVYGNAAYNVSGVQDPVGANGNISADPLFVNPVGGDYRLQPSSPCIDTGDDTAVSPGEKDLDGGPRLRGPHADMGAYEAHSAPRVVYVNKNTPGGLYDGSSWATAFRSVQAGIDAAGSGDQVWVAASMPTTLAYVEQVSLKDGTVLYGGFSGTEIRLEQRDTARNVTVLDGNRNGSVVTVPATVVQAARLDGFTVRNGYQRASGIHGAGVTVAGHAVIVNNTITGNTAEGVSGGTANISEYGGGVYVSGDARITGNTITGNSADNGGGVYVAGSATIESNSIRGNIATLGGFTFGHGAGICYEGSGGTVTIRGNTIVANSAVVSGAGIYSGIGAITIANNVIGSNSSEFGGGGGITAGGNATIVNNTIAGNKGGGASVSGAATLANNTIIGNSASDGGGIVSSGTVILANNIIAFNATGLFLSSGTLALSHNDIYGNASYDVKGVADPTGANGNISVDPIVSNRFHDIHLQPDSPCIDAGDDAFVFGPTDEFGKPRFLGAHVDIGADESNGTPWPSLPIFHVSPDGDDAKDGLTWATAKKTVSGALNVALGGDEVWVAKGVYTGNLALPTGLALYGGFAGTESQRSQRDYRNNLTVLDGNGSGTVVDAELPGVVIDGFTVRNGGNRGIAAYGGGGVVANNIVTSNAGGGIISLGGITIVNNTIWGNSATQGAGAFIQGNGSVVGNIIASNTATNFSGGGLYVSGNPTIAGNVIQGNSSPTSTGGGIYINGSPVITSNLIVGNYSGFAVGAGIAVSGAPSIVNNTIVGNTNTRDGGGVYLESSGSTLTNNIIANNSSGVVTYSTTTAVTLRNNDVYGNTAYNYKTLADPTGANGNITANPLFVNTAAGDYHLMSGSSCINSGLDSVVTAGQTDLDGRPRKLGAHVDIGAYEFLTAGYYSMADVVKALRITSGVAAAGLGDITRLHLVPGSPSGAGIWLPDATRIARKATGLDPNP